jgi:hypothetical protein
MLVCTKVESELKKNSYDFDLSSDTMGASLTILLAFLWPNCSHLLLQSSSVVGEKQNDANIMNKNTAAKYFI